MPITWPMLRTLLRMALSSFITVMATTWRRLLGRPAHRSWSWLEEVIIGTLRRELVAAQTASVTQIRALPPASLTPRLRRAVSETITTLGKRPCSVFTPRDWTPGDAECLYLHGGGYVTCSPQTHRLLIARIAAATGSRCHALDYRLAPEHAAPHALDDADAALDELMGSGIDAKKLWIGGDSAGGGLTIATLLRRGEGDRPMPAAAVVFSPWVDLTATGASVEANAHLDYLQPPVLRRFGAWYADDRPLDDPLVSPIRGELRHMPPTLVITGGAELFVSENRELDQRMRDAGVDVTYMEADAMVHVYCAVLPFHPETSRAHAAVSDFVKNKIANNNRPKRSKM